MTLNNGMFSSNTDLWATPQNFFDELNKEFHFELDVCALHENAKCKRYFSPEIDGLSQKWSGVCWMNPPYGREIGQWVEKAYNSYIENDATVVCLLPARTDTRWWHDYIWDKKHNRPKINTSVRFIKGRLKFGDSNNSAPFPSVIVIFSKDLRYHNLRRAFNMSFLSDAFRETMKQSKDPRMSAEAQTQVGYPTGFLNLDYKNGMRVQCMNMDGEIIKEYPSIGIADGSINMFIGASGTGKTTAVLQAAANIVAPFDDSVIIHEDIEGGTNAQRFRQLTGWDNMTIMRKYIRRNTGITAENFYERIKAHADIKMANIERLTYETGLLDEFGQPILKLIPSVTILDSLALLMPGNYSEEEQLSGQMSATAAAKANAMIFKRLAQICKQANIILMVVNHVNMKVELNPAARTKKQVNTLKGSESLPGGNTPIYLSNNIFKFEHSGDLVSTETYKIDGFYSTVHLIKSRSNKSGQTVKLVYNQETGFDPVLSLFEMLKDEKIIKSSASMSFEGLDIKFSNANFKTKLTDNPTLQKRFYDTCLPILHSYIPQYNEKPMANKELSDYMMNQFNVSVDNGTFKDEEEKVA